MLDGEGVDLLEISGGSYETPVMFSSETGEPKAASTVAREAYFLSFARRVRAVSKMPLMVTGGFRSREAMEAALEEGALDVVGMARPLAVEPELPRRLLDRSTERATHGTPFRLSIRALSVVAEGAWFGRQLTRMGRGLDPDPTLGAYWSIILFMFGEFLHAFLRRTPTRARQLAEATP